MGEPPDQRRGEGSEFLASTLAKSDELSKEVRFAKVRLGRMGCHDVVLLARRRVRGVFRGRGQDCVGFDLGADHQLRT